MYSIYVCFPQHFTISLQSKISSFEMILHMYLQNVRQKSLLTCSQMPVWVQQWSHPPLSPLPPYLQGHMYNNLSGQFFQLKICLQLYSVWFRFCPDSLRLFLLRSTSKEIHRWTVISDSPLVSSFSLSSSSMSNSDSLSSYSTFSSSSLKSGANALQFSYHHIR